MKNVYLKSRVGHVFLSCKLMFTILTTFSKAGFHLLHCATKFQEGFSKMFQYKKIMKCLMQVKFLFPALSAYLLIFCKIKIGRFCCDL